VLLGCHGEGGGAQRDEGAAQPANDGGADRLPWQRTRSSKRSAALLGRQRTAVLLGYHGGGGAGVRWVTSKLLHF
jgi:hypothetical protein